MSLDNDLGSFSWGAHPDGKRETPLSVTNTRVIATRPGQTVRVQDLLDMATELRNTPEVDTNDEVLVRWSEGPQLLVVAHR